MAASGRQGLAEQIIFTIQGESSITWSGAVGPIFGSGDLSIVPQSPGSLTAGVSGHFLVDFDSSTNTPASLSFIGGHGFYELDSLQSAPLNGGGPLAPANVAGKSGNEAFVFAVRDLSWDLFTNTAIDRAGSVYPANTTYFTILNGSFDSNVGSETYTGASNNIDSGDWTLTESNGEWTLSADVSYTYGDADIEFTANTHIVSKAQFSPANVVDDVPSQVGATEPVVIQANGESGTPGGVTVSLPPLPEGSSETGVTSVVVQSVPNLTDLSQAAIEAFESIPIFAAALESASEGGPQNLQIWNVHPTGFVVGTSATLVFNYDPSLFQGIDQSKLGIWHFNKISGNWDWGGTVDVDNHTITYVTNSFSEFIAGVPEPSTLVLGVFGLIGLLTYTWRRKR
jgi:hypothetical protein